MSEYKLTGESWVLRLSDGARISIADSPDEPNTNPHYLEYVGWLASGGVPVPADPVQLSTAQKLQLNNAAYEHATGALTADYPQMEKDTWPTQDAESRAWLDNPVEPTPWIDRAAAVRGIDRDEYLRRTLLKAGQFVIMSAWLTGRRQGYEDAIRAGGNPELDYQLPPEVWQELAALQQTVMGTPTEQLKEALA